MVRRLMEFLKNNEGNCSGLKHAPSAFFRCTVLARETVCVFILKWIMIKHSIREAAGFVGSFMTWQNLNEGVYNFPKSNSQAYRFAYKLHFSILDHGQNFEGSFE